MNTRDNCGWTPLHEACNYGFLETARILIKSGAQVDDPGGAGCEGVTPLIDAATNGHASVVSLLVKNGADMRITNSKVIDWVNKCSLFVSGCLLVVVFPPQFLSYGERDKGGNIFSILY